MSSEEAIKKEDLYIYTLKEDITRTLELLYFDSLTFAEVEIKKSSPPSHYESLPLSNKCNRCNINLPNQGEKLSHYKSDFHRLNIKREVNNLPALTEDEFDKLLEEESIESLSGSDSEEDATDDESKGLDTILEKYSIADKEEEESSVSFLNTKSPFILFKSEIIKEKALGAYKCLFSNKDSSESIVKSLRSWTNPPVNNGKSALFMVGGGHFAGAIVSHTRKNIKGNAPSKETKQEQMVDIVKSKTFHRYTTRRKQGGSQSSNDNAKGKANSAGSGIRRYNEAALTNEVRELLQSWKKDLNECTRIFVRANSASNKKALIGEGAILKSDDPRLRSFPFSTKRATTKELKKAWVQLSYLQLVEPPKVNEKKPKKAVQKDVNVEKKVDVLTENEKHSQELVNLLKKQKAPLLLSYIKKNKLSPNFVLEPDTTYYNYPSLLHFASSHSLNHMVQVLLINLKGDPCIKNKAGKTPYDLAKEINTKRTFQVARHQLGEDVFDWEAARVGPPKSRAEIEKEDLEEKKRVEEEKMNRIQEELSKKTDFESQKHGNPKGNRLSHNARENIFAGLNDDQKARLMREQRARAAEARLKNLQAQ